MIITQREIMAMGYSKREARNIRHLGEMYGKALVNAGIPDGKPKAGFKGRIARERKSCEPQ